METGELAHESFNCFHEVTSVSSCPMALFWSVHLSEVTPAQWIGSQLRYIASGSENSTVRIWDVVPRRIDHRQLTHFGHDGCCVAFSPRMYHYARTGDAVKDSPRSPSRVVSNIAFSSDGSRLVSGNNTSVEY